MSIFMIVLNILITILLTNYSLLESDRDSKPIGYNYSYNSFDYSLGHDISIKGIIYA